MARIFTERFILKGLLLMSRALIVGGLTLIIYGLAAGACKRTEEDRWPTGMTKNQAVVESAKLLQTPVGECWGGDGSWQCLTRTGLWTACDDTGCQLIMYVHHKDRTYFGQAEKE